MTKPSRSNSGSSPAVQSPIVFKPSRSGLASASLSLSSGVACLSPQFIDSSDGLSSRGARDVLAKAKAIAMRSASVEDHHSGGTGDEVWSNHVC